MRHQCSSSIGLASIVRPGASTGRGTSLVARRTQNGVPNTMPRYTRNSIAESAERAQKKSMSVWSMDQLSQAQAGSASTAFHQEI